jgi:hypothetical protein
MLAFETAIAISHLARMHSVEGKPRADDFYQESRRAARSGLLALASGFGIIGLFVLALDISATRNLTPGSDQLASRHGVSE